MRRSELIDNRFEVELLAGSGGMGEVYRARDRTTQQPVAVKIMRGHGGTDAVRFEREARILSEIEDPLVVGYVTHGTLPTGEPYLVMEWLDGEDLGTRLGRGRLSVADSLTLAIAAGEALGVLHRRGIVHRDMKPSNIFLVQGRMDRIKLLDFGVARPEAATRMTRSGAMLGTVAYMAPEQARGAADLDARADVFALGCVLFECLTGELPFSAMHAAAILTKILFEQAPRLSDRLSGMPPALDALLSRMLSKEPQDRPLDGHAVAESLRALGDIRLANVGFDATVELVGPSMLTGSEQRAVAVILVGPVEQGAAVDDTGDCGLELDAAAHSGQFERLLDGTAAVLLSSSQVVTDLAAQAARCALALGRRAPGRRIALAMGSGKWAARLPMGPAIDRAARLLGSDTSPPSEARHALIVLDEAAAGLLDAQFDVRDEGGVLLLHGERDVAEVRTLLGRPTPCVGRDRELRLLEQLFGDCVQESAAQAVLVTAPAGVGKSRLGREFLRKVRNGGEPVAVWIGRGDALRAGSAFSLLGQTLRAACGVRDGEPLEARRDKVRACVEQRVPEQHCKRVTEFLGEIIGTPFPHDDSLPLRAARSDAQLMNDQMRAAVLDFLAAESARHPVLILLEDLHWGDRSTVQLIGRVLRDLRERPLFVLALARPEVRETFPSLWAECGVQQVSLRELNQKAIERLARHVLGDKATAETVERIAQLSEGNAFYLEELIRWAAEQRGNELPETVVAMVQSRLGALDDISRRFLRAASVFGEACWTGAVAALLGGERDGSVWDWLRRLVERELLVKRGESRFPGHDEFAFRHALLREGAYAMLTDDDRALGHRLAGQWLEAHGEQDALLLAEHFEKGGDGEQAGRHYLRAVEQACAGGDSPAAIACIDRALGYPVLAGHRLQLLGALCQLHYYRVELAGAAIPHAQEVLRAAEPGGMPWAQALIIEVFGSLRTGRMDDFAKAVRALLVTEIQPEAMDPASVAIATATHLLDLSGQVDQADPLHARLEMLTAAFAGRVPSAAVLADGFAAYRSTHPKEDPWTGLLRSRRGVVRAEAIGHTRYLFVCKVFWAMSAWHLGGHAEAARLLEEVIFPDEELGLGSSARPLTLAWTLADLGSFAEARRAAENLVATGKRRGLPLDEAIGRWVLAEVLRRAGDLDAADPEIDAALAVLGMVCPLSFPSVMASLAALRLAQGRPGDALAAAQQAMARYQAMGACGFFRGSFLSLVHAECLHATGDHEGAKAAIAKARDRLHSLAGTIAAGDYRKSFLENVPENRRTIELATRWLQEQP